MASKNNYGILHIPTQRYVYYDSARLKIFHSHWKNILNQELDEINADQRCGLWLASTQKEAVSLINKETDYFDDNDNAAELRRLAKDVKVFSLPKHQLTYFLHTWYFKSMMLPDIHPTLAAFHFYIDGDSLRELWEPFKYDFEVVKC